MAVRVPVEIKFGNKTAYTVAIANSGFETNQSQILLPQSLAIKFWKAEVRKAKSEMFKTAGGPAMFMVIGRGMVTIKDDDALSGQADAEIIVASTEDEVILNDRLLDALGIQIIKAGVGLWRHSSDAPENIRNSSNPQRWK